MATLGGLLFGYDTAVISGTVESLRKFFIEPFGLPLDQANALEGFVVSSALIGCILGASFAGWISQRYGRKPTLVLAAILFLLSAIGSAWPELFVGMPGSGVAGRCRLVAYDRLALDVRVRNRPGFALSGPSDVCTGNASLFGDAR